MKLDNIKCLAVLGSGTMGHGIAMAYALGGYETYLHDINENALELGIEKIKRSLFTFAEAELIDKQSIPKIISKIHPSTNFEETVRDADFVTESITEDIKIKKQVFEMLEKFCSKESILTTNTSSLLVDEISANIEKKDRVLLTHFFNPAHIVPVVEIANGSQTSVNITDMVVNFFHKIKKVPVKINKILPGLLVNRIQMAIRREVWSLYEQGVASPEDIDLAVKGTFGFRLASIGPFLTYDLAGLDLAYRVSTNLFPKISDSHEVPDFIKQKVAANELGRKTGKGMFDFSEEKWQTIVRNRDKEFLDRLKRHYWKDSL